VIIDNLKKLEKSDPAAEPGKRVIVRELVIRNIVVHVDLVPAAGNLLRTDVPIEEIRLHDIGADSPRGTGIGKVFGVVVQSVLEAVARKGDQVPGEIGLALRSGLGGLGSLGKHGAEAAGGVLEGVGNVLEGAGEAVTGALKGVGGLLGGEKEKKEGEKP
jgi:hypothetical protein